MGLKAKQTIEAEENEKERKRERESLRTCDLHELVEIKIGNQRRR
jgi:hypothetical protein